LSKGYAKEVSTLQEYLASTQKNLTLLTNFSQRLQTQESFEIETLTQLLGSSIKFEQSLNESRFHLHDQITGKCNIPLIDFSKKDLHGAFDQKQKWSQTRLNHDAVILKLENEKKKPKSTKVKEIEAELQGSQSKYDSMDRETNKSLNGTIKNGQHLAIQTLLEHIKLYQKFFQEGTKMIEEMLPVLKEAEIYLEESSTTNLNSSLNLSSSQNLSNSDNDSGSERNNTPPPSKKPPALPPKKRRKNRSQFDQFRRTS